MMKKTVFYHAKPEFILRGHDFTVGVAISGANDDVSIEWLSDCRPMKLTGKYEDNDCFVFSTVIPASAFENADTLSYRFVSGGESSGYFTVPVNSAGRLPPLMVTEFYARPKGLEVTLFIEVSNPTSCAVDLYDYKILAYKGDETGVSAPICVLPLSDERGTEVIAPGEVAVLWPLFPKNHNTEDGRYATVNGFIDACMNDFPKPAFDLRTEKDSIRIIPVEASRFDNEAGKYVLRDGVKNLPIKTELTTLVIAPHDCEPENGVEEAVYKMVYNRDSGCDRDTPVRHSSVWSIDVRKPSQGIVIAHHELMTPGRLSRGQAIPDFKREYPVIIPLSAGKKLNASNGDMPISFTLAAGRATDAYIELKCADGKYRRFDADENDGIFTAVVPDDVTMRLKRLEYIICVFDGVRRATLGSTVSTLLTAIADDRGPTVLKTAPSELYCYDNERTPLITVDFYDVSGVDQINSVLCVDKKNVSRKASWSAGNVSYRPERPLRYGEHSFEVMLCDSKGNKTYKKVRFSLCQPDRLNFYRGEIHSHTADSDGIADPATAFTYARNIGGADFFAVTDHSHYMASGYYTKQIKTADLLDEPGRFAAIYGWEMTWNNASALWGHMNILNAGWIENDIESNGIPEIFERLSRDREAIAMFDHPGLAWGNFHDFGNYSQDADRAVCLAEIKGAGYDREYMNMLALGWHASPAFSEDNHGFNWTTATQSTTFALAPALTRDNILDAFRRRRTYSTSDPTMKISFRVNGEWMGARLSAPSVLDIDAEIRTEAERGIGTISLVTEDNIVVASVNAGALREFRWKLTVKPDFDYYYLKITSPGQYSVTSPVWVEGRAGIKIKSFTRSRGTDDYKPNVMTAKISNDSDTDIKKLKVDFYLTSAAGFDLERTLPYASVTLPSLGAGKTARVSCKMPDIAGIRRASVVAAGCCGTHRTADTTMAQLSPVVISEIVPKSESFTMTDGTVISNAFPYIQLHNVSNRTVNLNGYYTRLWWSTGKQPTDDRMQKLDGYSIPAGGVLTIWVRPSGSVITAEDFNQYYGVMMKDGSDLLVTEIKVLSSAPEAARIELMCDKETLSRAEYNFKQIGSDINPGKAIGFDSSPSLTGTSKIITTRAEPSPASAE